MERLQALTGRRPVGLAEWSGVRRGVHSETRRDEFETQSRCR